MKTRKNNIRFEAGITIKTLSLLITIALLVSVFPAVMGTLGTTDSEKKITLNYVFGAPVFVADGEFVAINVDGASLQTSEPRAPSLPRCNVTANLPLGSIVTDVKVTHSPMIITTVPEEKMISPVPIPIPLLMPNDPLWDTIDIDLSHPINTDIYDSSEPYGELFTYNVYAGLENDERMISVVGNICPVTLLSPVNSIVEYTKEVTIEISYTTADTSLSATSNDESYNLLILSPSAYLSDLQPLVTHKEDMGLKTKLVSLDDIYSETYFPLSDTYNRDNQEKIKYFIYNAILEWNISYCMAVGGYRTFFGLNVPSKQFPVRWVEDPANDEPGYVTDQYYSCCIRYSTSGKPFFASWDTNNDGKYDNPDDVKPDVYFGRLACRNRVEVRTMVNKIITYETPGPQGAYGSDWFNRILGITGDGFQDINIVGQNLYTDRNVVSWPINNNPSTSQPYPDGDYVIYAQSKDIRLYSSTKNMVGPIDEVHVTLDRTKPSVISFGEEDHLKIEPIDPMNQTADFPGKAVAEIVIPCDGDVLGNTEVNYIPPENIAYIGDYWAIVGYNPSNGLGIRFKSYTPSYYPHGSTSPSSQTQIRVWINNSDGETVFESPWTAKPNQVLYYEGEMECDKALTNMESNGFDVTRLYSSNGQWTGMGDVIDEFSNGYGFVYFAGHGNPMSWGDHLPGIPGGRANGMINGMKCINLEGGTGWERYYSEEGDPFFPMDWLTNGYKQPVTLIGGCHNSFIDASFMRMFTDPNDVFFTVLHGAWVPECFSWWFVRMPQGGSIATIGCTGLGYGRLGSMSTSGLGGWINPEFFNVYIDSFNRYKNNDILGVTFTQTLINYINTFTASDPVDLKTFEEWMFLGDPSLKIGGYPPETGTLEEQSLDTILNPDVVIGDLILLSGNTRVETNITNIGTENLSYFTWEIRFDEISPLGRYMGLSTIPFLYNLLGGHVLRGAITTEDVMNLKPGKTLEITSASPFGFGHIEVNVSVYNQDGDLIAWKVHENPDFNLEEEDGFLLGSHLFLFNPEV